MAVRVYHTHQTAIANDPTKDISADVWNADLTVTGLGTAAESAVGDFATAAQGALADTAVQPGDLAAVATTGAYADLSGKPTIDPALIFVSAVSPVALANSNAAQSIFGSANDELTVDASSTYLFDGVIRTIEGAAAHTVSFGFGGTATLTSIGYDGTGSRIAAGALSTSDNYRWVATAAMTVLTSAGTTTGTTLRVKGIVRVDGAGTLIPQLQFSADPTGTCQVEPNSYMTFRKLGSDTVASAGAWA